MLVTKKAPDFTATAVLGNNEMSSFNLYENLGEKGTVLFFYPLDFTFVCPTEIIAFDHRLEDFRERGVNIIGVSVDSQFSHFAWKSTAVEKGGIGNIRYPLIADLDKSIARSYDVLIDAGLALRASFLLDADGTVRHAVINDTSLGRNIDEMLRMVDAMQFTNEHGEVCPAGWNKSKPAIKATMDGVADYLAQNSEKL